MVVSSKKKKRGQQRKVAKNENAAAKAILGAAFLSCPGERKVNSQEDVDNLVAKLSRDIEKGNDAATRSIFDSDLHQLNPRIQHELSTRVMPDVLNFLGRCEDETFARVLSSVGGDMGKKLKTPSTWIMVVKSFDKSLRLQIAESIGRLVRCMCNDTERMFFKSNKHWRDGIMPFVLLICRMIDASIDKEVVDTLLNHDGLLSSIVQWEYWSEEYRPDLVEELGADTCAHIVSIGRDTIRMLVTHADADAASIRGRDLLEAIGTLPIVSKVYDPNCMISFVVGLIRDVKKEGIVPSEGCIISVLQPLMYEGDCIDNDVIAEFIDLGMNYVYDYGSAEIVAELSQCMLCKGGIPSDTRIAFALRSGLVEMCLDFIERFGTGLVFVNFLKRFGSGGLVHTDAPNLFHQHIEQIFTNIHKIVLHQKTAKAVRSKRRSIEEELARLDQNTNVTTNAQSKKLLGMVRSIIDMSGSYCCRCNKSLTKTEVKQCNGCSCMVYCSRACQKEDWLDGHSVTCCKSFTHKEAGHFQGRILPAEAPDNERDARKIDELEKNITMIQLKLFLDHSETILSQAKALDLPLCDCVIKIDLRHYPPRVGTKCYTEFFQTDTEHLLGFEMSRSEDNITCIYASSLYIGGSEERLALQRFFPHEWLMKQTESESVAVATTD